MSVLEMAKAHLGNVKKAIDDLEQQKNNIDTEINKLTIYLANGMREIEENSPKPEGD
jgi:hypothetical protein